MLAPSQSSGSSSLLIVIPTYNEVDNIDPLIDEVLLAVPHAHLLFVDDNSTDGTRARIGEHMARRPGIVHMLPREGKLGLGTAYVAGFRWALARDYQAVVEMDADLSHRPVDLPVLVAGLETDHVVVGSRYVRHGGTLNWGLGRQFISRLGGLYARTILGMRIHDMTGGFNAWRREVIEAINLDDIQSEGYSFQIELKYRAHLAGFRIGEIPIIFVERRAGQSKMSSAIVIEAIARVWSLALGRSSIMARMAERSATRQSKTSSPSSR